jgi:hypothetical protein
MPALSKGTSLAVLTYIGFDGISTLSEEAENPRRNILLATVFTCLLTGVLATLQVYLGQLVWPNYTTYPDADTAFVYVAGRAGGLHAAGGNSRIRRRRATVGRASALRHGARRRDPASFLWSHRTQAPHPAE